MRPYTATHPDRPEPLPDLAGKEAAYQAGYLAAVREAIVRDLRATLRTLRRNHSEATVNVEDAAIAWRDSASMAVDSLRIATVTQRARIRNVNRPRCSVCYSPGEADTLDSSGRCRECAP